MIESVMRIFPKPPSFTCTEAKLLASLQDAGGVYALAPPVRICNQKSNHEATE